MLLCGECSVQQMGAIWLPEKAAYTDWVGVTLIYEALAFLVGLLCGSFLNVCIVRLPYHESVVKPRSHCPACMNAIAWYDNIPLVSWVALKRRCRKCFQKISWQYPLVELAVGLWFAFAALRISYGITQASGDIAYHAPSGLALTNIGIDGVGFAVIGFLLIGLLVMDWQTHVLPDAFTLTGTAIGFFLICVQAIFLPTGADDIHLHRSMRMSSPGSMVEKGDVFLTGTEHLVFGRLLAIVAAAGLLLLIRAAYKAVRKQEGLGLGDVKLLAMIAAFLGFWPAMLSLFLGVVMCSFYAVVLLVRGKAGAMTKLPLGSFLALGGLIAAVVGGPLIGWYSGLL